MFNCIGNLYGKHCLSIVGITKTTIRVAPPCALQREVDNKDKK